MTRSGGKQAHIYTHTYIHTNFFTLMPSAFLNNLQRQTTFLYPHCISGPSGAVSQTTFERVLFWVCVYACVCVCLCGCMRASVYACPYTNFTFYKHCTIIHTVKLKAFFLYIWASCKDECETFDFQSPLDLQTHAHMQTHSSLAQPERQALWND